MARMLSTVDNPYDPRTSWDEWFAFDTALRLRYLWPPGQAVHIKRFVK